MLACYFISISSAFRAKYSMVKYKLLTEGPNSLGK